MASSQSGVLKFCLIFFLWALRPIRGEEEGKPLTLTILHTNDVHSRVLETNRYSGGCSAEAAAKKECFGGFSRIHSKVCEIRKTHSNVVYVSGGDYFQGTIWYTLFKWEVVARFVNQFHHTAMALGNHEFDDGVEGLLPFLQNVTFPVISSNIDVAQEPKLAGKIQKSVIVEFEGRKVGIIGYTTRETVQISKPGNVKFAEEFKSVAEEARRLDAQGVKILLAVGHAGFDVDRKIATVPHIDVVVGGHTNTFLYSGEKMPDSEEALGKYPTVITTNGRGVPVVQAYAYGKYLGYLNVTFDPAGEVTSWTGNPILLDGTVLQDPTMEAEVQAVGKDVIASSKKRVGETLVHLEGDSNVCRLKECNLGSLIADAMVEMSMEFADEVDWSKVSLAIMNGGSIRASIANGSVSLEDILTVLPFQNTIDLVEIKGRHLREVFEFAVEGYDPKGFRKAGKFLQVSGIRVVYDTRCPQGKRVKELSVLKPAKGKMPIYAPLNDEIIYKVALPTYLAEGGDGYKTIRQNRINYHRSGTLDSDMLLEYLKSHSPITQTVDRRIKILNENETDDSLACSSNKAYFRLSWSGFQQFILILVILMFQNNKLSI